jgi:primosomal protein N' (replication factor Y)
MAAVDGPPAAVAALLEAARLPETSEVLGPVDLPPGARSLPGTDRDAEVARMLVRVPRDTGLELASALRRATGVFSARHDQPPVRVQIDPLHIG